MRLELRHALILFFSLVMIDFIIFVWSDGDSVYNLGGLATSNVFIIPATVYLLSCFVCATFVLKKYDYYIPPKNFKMNWKLPWILAIIVVLLVLIVSGSAFFSIDALNRQTTFRNNPWIPRIVLFALPLAMLSIICARPWPRLALFFLFVGFFSLTGSRIHVMALILTLITSYSNKIVRLKHLVIGGLIGMVILDFLAAIREGRTEDNSFGSNLTTIFSSGHYSTFDIQTMLMQPSESFSLEPSYVLFAAIGPLRNVFGLESILSSSEYFTLKSDPFRYYNSLSLATVGLSGELYMIFGWIGAVLVGFFVGFVALLKRFFYWLSNYNHQMEILLRTLGFLYLYLILRSDMWIFFVYLWLQIPILFLLAIYFAKTKRRQY